MWQTVNINFYVKIKETATDTFSLLLEGYGKMPELHKALSQNDFSGHFEAWQTSCGVVCTMWRKFIWRGKYLGTITSSAK